MKVFLVNAGGDYYPSSDNTLFVTTDRDRAEKSRERLQKSGGYDWVEIYTKGVDE